MELERCEENPQNCIESKSKTSPIDMKTRNDASRGSIQKQVQNESKGLVSEFASPTPTKTAQPPRAKNKHTGLSLRAADLFSKENEDGAVEEESVEVPDGITGYDEAKITNAEAAKVLIPEKYKPLAELFDRVDTSIRLLSMHKKLPTFQNICTVVKALTQRMLSFRDLAQIKYVLPESIRIEKILIQDDRTLCMIPDMKITFVLDVIEPKPNQSAFMALREVFHQRLLDFFNHHSESSDIPEAMLPEPFGQKNQSVLPDAHAGNSPVAHFRPECEPLTASSSSIRKHFSQKITVPEIEKTQLLVSPVPPLSVHFDDETKECSSVSDSASSTVLSSSQCSSSSVSESSPKKFVTASSLTVTVETPVQPTPAKRLPELSSCEKAENDTRVLGLTAAKRSLNFDESKQLIDESLETAMTKKASPAVTKVVAENTNQSDTVKRQQLLSFSTDILNIIQSIFKSASGSLITKQELLQKIIANNLDIEDIREAEEQLELLEKVAPNWIFHKKVPSGDVIYSIRKGSDLEAIRAKLARAV